MTIKDIARISGYGVSTVSRALNGHPDISQETRRKIEETVREYKFVPNSNARQLKQTVGKNILIIVNGTSNMFFASVVEGMQAEIDKKGLNAVFHYIDERADEIRVAQKLINEQKPLGIIFLGGNADCFQSAFSTITTPCVLCTADAQPLGFSNLASVSVNDRAAGEGAIEYLYEKGHRHIGLIGGTTVGFYAASSRFQGSVEAMRRHGLDFEETAYIPARFSLQSGYEAAITLLKRDLGITAIFAMSDIMAIGAMRAIIDQGYSVPNDISIIGFDGIPLTQYLNPKLTTFRQPADRLASLSVQLLTKQINGEEASHITLAAELLKGGSVKTLN